MPYSLARGTINVPSASTDGKYYGSYPHGGAPAINLTANQAARLMNQGTFGATLSGISAMTGATGQSWIASQAAITPTSLVAEYNSSDVNAGNLFLCWMQLATMAPDALRQRVAFALSEILVVATKADASASSIIYYYDVLINGAFGSFRTLLYNLTLNFAMGQWLSAYQNQAGNPATGTHADENYAREIMQLFSIGLVLLNQDGTPTLDGNGNTIPTYNQTTIQQMAKVFTGMACHNNNNPAGSNQAFYYDVDAADPMVFYDQFHDTTQKTILGGVVLPANQTTSQDINATIDVICNHPNVGPFIGKQLIQKLVTSNPSPGYVKRVATIWANDGSGNRGNLQAVIQQILCDSEAQNQPTYLYSQYGKVREPLVRMVQICRATGASNYTKPAICADGFQQINAVYSYLQSPMLSPSVFNFFTPGYQPSGAIAQRGLLAPEVQIINEYSYPVGLNLLVQLCSQWINSMGTTHENISGGGTPNTSTTLIPTSSWESLATSNQSGMVDQMNQLFMAGTMTAALKSVLTTYAATISTSNPWQIFTETLMLLQNSPQYQVQT